jgi:hypothetical protein
MAKSLQVVITIGHQHVLLPDDTGVSTILKALSRGISCHSYLGCGSLSKVQILKGDLEVSMAYVPSGAKIIDENDQPVAVRSVKGTPKALKQPSLLALMEGGAR